MSGLRFEELNRGISRVLAHARGELCIHCKAMQDEHGPDGKCLFDHTHFQGDMKAQLQWMEMQKMERIQTMMREVEEKLTQQASGYVGIALK